MTARSATLTGAVNPEGRETTYYFEYGPTNAYGLLTSATSAGSASGKVFVTAAVESLAPGTTYHYRLLATSAAGTSEGADVSFRTSKAPPPAVAAGAVHELSATSATATGTVNPEGQETSYYFQYGPTSAYGSQSSTTPAGAGKSNVQASAELAALTPGITYHFRLVAVNASGTSFSADATFRTRLIPLPTAATGAATAVAQTSATLTGTVNPKGQDSTYYFQYGPTKAYGNSTPVVSAGSGISNVRVVAGLEGLLPDAIYHYRLVASDAGGSAIGHDGSFTTLAGATSITLSALPAEITFGQTTTLSGSVRPAMAHRTVTLQQQPSAAQGFVDIATATTNAAGAFAFAHISPSTNRRFRVLVDGALSGQVRVLVRFRVTLLVSNAHPRRLHTVRFDGLVTPRHNGLRVLVQRLIAPGRWRTLAITRLRGARGDASRFGVSQRIRKSGVYRALVGPDATHASGSSGALRIRAR